MPTHSPPDTTPLLEAQDVAINRRLRPVLRNIGLRLHGGECLFVEGDNGIGKTSLLRALCGLLPIDGGWIRRTDAEVCYVGASGGVHRGLSVHEQMRLWSVLAAASGADTPSCEHEDAVARRFGLSGVRRRLATELSHGVLRRLALSRLGVFRRRLWIVDEPLLGLDATGQSLFIRELETHIQHDGAAVIATNQPFHADVPTGILRLGTP